MTSNASAPAPPSDSGDPMSVSERIVLEIADREGIDAREVPVPLYDAINPEALESLFRGNSGRVTFEYMGYLVSVTHEHELTLVDCQPE